MKTAVFLYNPESGKGKIARNVGCISTIFQAYGYDVTPRGSTLRPIRSTATRPST